MGNGPAFENIKQKIEREIVEEHLSKLEMLKEVCLNQQNTIQ